jgi:hypothetical protein
MSVDVDLIEDFSTRNIGTISSLPREAQRELQVRLMERPENFKMREEFLRRDHIVNGIVNGIKHAVQNVHTPLWLCDQIINKLTEIAGISWFSGKKILVLNAEFLDIIYRNGMMWNNEIWFVSENPNKVKYARDIYRGNSDDQFVCANLLEMEPNMKFDAVVMNPPYQAATKGGNGMRDLWPEFVEKSMSLLKENGFLVAVHPSKWRRPEHFLWKKMSQKKMMYLEIHNKNDGKKTFGATTRYDWYVLQNNSEKSNTTVVDENGELGDFSLENMAFLPSGNIHFVNSILAKNEDPRCEVIYSFSDYEHRKKWMSFVQNSEYKFPVVYSITKEGIKWTYSSHTNNGQFGKQKVIVNIAENPYAFVDFDGKYGMGTNVFAIGVETKNEGDLVAKAINSKKFMDQVLKSTKWGNFQIDYRMFKYFKKDFWKYFVDKDGNPI